MGRSPCPPDDPCRRQRAFAEAVLNPAQPVPPGLIGPDGEPDAKRFAVYRNNVVAGLVDALKQAFPAVLRIVGDATLWSSTAGGVDSLRRLWSNVVRRGAAA